MLERIDLEKRIPREEYLRVFPTLETRLAACQRAARAAGVPVIVVFEGWDAAGKGHLVNRLTRVLDPRGFKVHATSAPGPDEQRRPWLWRFWRDVPPAGQWAVFDRSWYGRVLVERLERLAPKREWRRAYDEVLQFERQLADAGAVLVKFWLQIGRREQRKRFARIARDPATAWKAGPAEWRQQERYGRWSKAIEEMLRRTHAPCAPWTIVEATHLRYARTKVFRTVAEAVERAVAARAGRAVGCLKRTTTCSDEDRGAPHAPCRLDGLDLGLALERADYERRLARLHRKLFRLEHELYVARAPVVIVFEGWDAAGKGGVIKRLVSGLDPRGYEVVPVGPPNADEKARPWLWRFWDHVPKTGHVTIFDRSWYGRVLVERVEGFCTEAEWRRAYREINEFERQLADWGAVIVKFWLQIDADEQLRRFQARQQDPARQWKITDEDWRNRGKRPQYEEAVAEMLRRTDTGHAPWTVLEANCKLHARIKALRTVIAAVRAAVRSR